MFGRRRHRHRRTVGYFSIWMHDFEQTNSTTVLCTKIWEREGGREKKIIPFSYVRSVNEYVSFLSCFEFQEHRLYRRVPTVSFLIYLILKWEKNRSALKQYILHDPTGILFSMGALASGLTCTHIHKYHMCQRYVFHSFYIRFHFIRKPIVNMNLKTNSTTMPTTSKKMWKISFHRESGWEQQEEVTFPSDYDDFLRDSDRCQVFIHLHILMQTVFTCMSMMMMNQTMVCASKNHRTATSVVVIVKRLILNSYRNPMRLTIYHERPYADSPQQMKANWIHH